MRLADFPDAGKVSQVADVVGADVKSIYRLIESGELKAVRIGRTYRVTRHALCVWLGVPDPLAGEADDAAS